MTETTVRTQNELSDWWHSVIPGDVAVYHRGLLMFDRDQAASKMLPHDRLEMIETANLAWRMYEAGQVTLVQRRAGGDMEYLAIKRPRR